MSDSAEDKAPPGGLRGDLLGGICAAIIALPVALDFGVAAFAPLGSDGTPT